MPFFDEKSDVFPPVVPPVGKLGDVPAFAQAVGEDVVAWNPPDGFRYREYDYIYFFHRESDNARLVVHTMFRFDGEQRTAREQIEWDVLESHRRLLQLVADSAGPNPYGIVVPLHDEVMRVTDGADELHVNWWGTFSGGNKTSEGGTQAVTVFVLDSDGRASAIEVEAEDDEGRRSMWRMSEVRAQLLTASPTRAPCAATNEQRFWTPYANFSVGPEWIMGQHVLGSASWDPAPADLSFRATGVEVRQMLPRSDQDFLDLVARELRTLDQSYSKATVTRTDLPSYGHVFIGARELKRESVTHVPDPNDEPDPFDTEPHVYQGETIRLASVAVGRDHAVILRISVGDWALGEIEALWRQCLERLHVTRPAAEENSTR